MAENCNLCWRTVRMREHTHKLAIPLEVLGRGWDLNNFLCRHANANTQTIIRDSPLDHTQTDEWLTPRTCIIHGTVDESVQLVYHHRLVCNLSLTAGERCATMQCTWHAWKKMFLWFLGQFFHLLTGLKKGTLSHWTTHMYSRGRGKQNFFLSVKVSTIN